MEIFIVRETLSLRFQKSRLKVVLLFSVLATAFLIIIMCVEARPLEALTRLSLLKEKKTTVG
jgi:cell division protein FtsL